MTAAVGGAAPRMAVVRRLLAAELAAELPADQLDVVVARLCTRIEPHVKTLPVPPAGLVVLDGDPLAEFTGPPLTPREVAVLAGAADGLTNEQIGRRLGISANTVKTYLKRACITLRARDRAHAAAIAVRRGLIA